MIAAGANLLTIRRASICRLRRGAGQNVGWSCGLAGGGLGNATTVVPKYLPSLASKRSVIAGGSGGTSGHPYGCRFFLLLANDRRFLQRLQNRQRARAQSNIERARRVTQIDGATQTDRRCMSHGSG